MKLNLEKASLSDVKVVVTECKSMITKRALASGGASIVPAPGIDIIADIGMLLELLPAITRKFGLEEDEVAGLPTNIKIIIAKVLSDLAADFWGKLFTKELLLSGLKRFSVRITSKQVTKYIPIIGSFVAATLGFTLMKIVGNSHVNDCAKAVEIIINKRDSIK